MADFSELSSNPLDIIAENLPSAFVLLDADLRILLASSAIKRIGDWGKLLPDGGYCAKILCGTRPCDVCRTRLALETGKAQRFAFSLGGGNGSAERHFEHKSIPVIGPNGDRQVLVVLTDVTEEVLTNDRLMYAERLSAVGEMAAVLSHGFRNSLTSLKMILQLHSETLDANDPERESMRIALGSVINMERIVGDLLSFANKKELSFSDCDVNALVCEAAKLLIPRIQGENVKLEMDLSPDLPRLRIDDSQLKEAVCNLLFNAREAMKGGGLLAVRTRFGLMDVESDKRYSGGKARGISASGSSAQSDRGTNPAPSLEIEISDEGEGIAPEIVGRIFDPFFTTKVNGSGLGLAIAKRVVEDHGGALKVEGNGKGSKFTIAIPLTGRSGRPENSYE